MVQWQVGLQLLLDHHCRTLTFVVARKIDDDAIANFV